MANTKCLDILFSECPHQLQKLRAEINNSSFFELAESLLAMARDSGIGGIEKLALPISGDKFVSLLSELRIANRFSRLGCSVEVLADEAFGRNGIYTPDLRAVTSFGDILIEVSSGSAGGVDMTSLIQKGLKDNDLRFRTTDYLAEDLSIPGISAEERAKAEEKVRATARKFISHLKALKTPEEDSILIDGTLFEFEPSPKEYGYHSGGVTAFHCVRSETHMKKLLRELEHKANKQQKLPPEYQSIPFIVAYDNKESELDPPTAFSALTGSRCSVSGPPGKLSIILEEKRAAYPDSFLAPFSGPWSRLIEDWQYGSKSEHYISKFGALFEMEWAQYLSAVLLWHEPDIIQWLPYPYAAPHLRSPHLLEIQLPTNPDGNITHAPTC